MANNETRPPVDTTAPDDATLNRFLDERHEHPPALRRTTAELQALRLRLEREAADAEQRGREAVLIELLYLLDVLDRHPVGTTVGLQLQRAHRQALDAIEHFGVTRFDVEPGELFDPLRHQAVDHVSCVGLPAGRIQEQRRPGYRHQDRMLRPAGVVVTGPDPDEPAPSNAEGYLD